MSLRRRVRTIITSTPLVQPRDHLLVVRADGNQAWGHDPARPVVDILDIHPDQVVAAPAVEGAARNHVAVRAGGMDSHEEHHTWDEAACHVLAEIVVGRDTASDRSQDDIVGRADAVEVRHMRRPVGVLVMGNRRDMAEESEKVDSPPGELRRDNVVSVIAAGTTVCSIESPASVVEDEMRWT
jgi:hypothetical protein